MCLRFRNSQSLGTDVQFFPSFKKHLGQTVLSQACMFDVKNTALINHLVHSRNILPGIAASMTEGAVSPAFQAHRIHINGLVIMLSLSFFS